MFSVAEDVCCWVDGCNAKGKLDRGCDIGALLFKIPGLIPIHYIF